MRGSHFDSTINCDLNGGISAPSLAVPQCLLLWLQSHVTLPLWPLLPPPLSLSCTLLQFACAAPRARARTLGARPYAMERGRARLKAARCPVLMCRRFKKWGRQAAGVWREGSAEARRSKQRVPERERAAAATPPRVSPPRPHLLVSFRLFGNNSSADPVCVLLGACGGARSDGAVIDWRPSVCSRVNNEEESAKGKRGAPALRLTYAQTCPPRVCVCVFCFLFFSVPRGALCPVQHRPPSSCAAKLSYAVSQLLTQMRCSSNLCFELTAPKFLTLLSHILCPRRADAAEMLQHERVLKEPTQL